MEALRGMYNESDIEWMTLTVPMFKPQDVFLFFLKMGLFVANVSVYSYLFSEIFLYIFHKKMKHVYDHKFKYLQDMCMDILNKVAPTEIKIDLKKQEQDQPEEQEEQSEEQSEEGEQQPEEGEQQPEEQPEEQLDSDNGNNVEQIYLKGEVLQPEKFTSVLTQYIGDGCTSIESAIHEMIVDGILHNGKFKEEKKEGITTTCSSACLCSDITCANDKIPCECDEKKKENESDDLVKKEYIVSETVSTPKRL